MKKHYSLFLFSLLSFTVAFGQSGPAGIGNSDGSNGQPENIIWLDASTLGLGDGAPVLTWPDLSGNGNDLVQLGSDATPLFETTGLFSGAHNTVRFDGTERYLTLLDNDDLDLNLGGITIIGVVYNAVLDGEPRGIYSKRNSSSSQESYSVFTWTGQRLNFDIRNTGDNRFASTVALNTTTDYILTNLYDGSIMRTFIQTDAAGTRVTSGNIANTTSNLILGALNENYGDYFDGDIAELIFYREGLNDGQRLIVENYLSEKYGISITNDFFGNDPNYNATFNNDLMGIGAGNDGGRQSISGESDALQIQELNGSLNSANEFIFFAHDNITHDQTETANTPDPEITDRWARSWFLEVTGSVSAELRFDFGDAGLGAVGSASDYVLLYRATTGDDFTRVLANSISIENTDQVVVNLSNLDMPTGYYTLGRGVQLVNRTFYSFQSGIWEDGDTWTFNPSGAPPRDNPLNEIPGPNDNVVILGDIVTMTTDNNDGINLTVNGRLNIENTTDHNFFTIAGNGIIAIEGSGGVDNFPTGSTTLFADSIVGGTVLIEAGNFDLNIDREFNNAIINLASPSNVVDLLADYRLNGDLIIQQGILSINDNSATDNLTIDVFGNVQVDASGEINVGSANARHQFNFYGDLLNNGRVEFTNRTGSEMNNETTEASNGIVDANFLDENANQTIECNGITNFYRIEIDKGADETYILDINATSAANFNIFGPVDYGHSSTAQLTTNDNALGLLRGTVRLNTNVDVPLLNNGGNYNISEAARLWVNGGSAAKVGGEAIVPYGIIQVSDGTLDAPVRSGITTRDNGTIIVEGGVLTVNQIRTSVLGAENIGGYFQSGGEVNVTGQNVQQNYYTFSLTYPGNTFNMSGGTLRVAGSDTFNDNTGGTSGQIHGGGIFIDSAPGNISVTGGTVIMENNTNVNFKVTSLAPFWNVIMRSTGGTATDVDLASGTSGDNAAGEFETILNPELLVLNDLIVESGVSFDPNGNDIEVGSDLIIMEGAEWDVPLNTAPSATYTLTLNGVDDSVLDLRNIQTFAECGTCDANFNVDQQFSNLIISKPAGRTVTLSASDDRRAEILSSGGTNLIKVVGSFQLQGGCTFDHDIYSIRLETTDVSIDGILGIYIDGVSRNSAQVKLRAATFTIQNTPDSEIGNLLFRSTDDIISIADDLYVKRLIYGSGIFNLGNSNLRVDELVLSYFSEADFGGCAGGCNSVEDMLVTSGQASDGGLSILIDGNGNYTFPFGVGTTRVEPASKYTPAEVSVSNFNDEGYITIRPVDAELLTTEPSGGDLLSYYWRVDFEDFGTPPTVEYQFNYYDEDLDGSGNESNFVAGKVLDANPFTRNYEDDGVPENEGVDDVNNTITFNGPVDTGFTLEEASYTAGQSGRFVGAPQVFYSRNSSPTNWTNTNAWSLSRDGGAAGDYPQEGDIAILTRDNGGAGDPTSYGAGVFNINNGTGPVTIAKLVFDDVDPVNNNWISGCPRVIFDTNGSYAAYNSNFGTVEVTDDHIGGPTPNQSHGAVMQYNVNSSYTGIFPGGDFGEFNEYENALVIYAWDGGTGTATLSVDANEYPMLWFQGGNSSNRIIEFPDTDVTVNGRANLNGNMLIRLNNNSSRTLTFKNNVQVGSGCCGRGFFEFDGNSSGDQTVIIEGNLDFNGSNGGQIRLINNSGSNVHNLTVMGNITVPNTGTINLGDGSNSVIELELQGASDGIFTNSGSVTLYRILMNKSSKSNTFSFNDSFILNGPTNISAKAVELISGTLVFDDPAIAISLTSGGDSFSIPADAGLQLSQGTYTVSGDDSGILLDGCLFIHGGTLDMDDAVGNGNNFIEYSASGNALLEISAGVLNVGSQIRGITTAETGVLRYRQTGGDVRVGTQTGPESTRGMLQIYNTGSEFTFTGGTLQIERHQSSPSVAALFLNPDDSDVTQPIQIFNANTPAGQNDFRINSVIPLQELIIAGTNSPSAEIDINALTIEGNLTIEAGGTLNGNGRTLTIGGDFVNQGSYDAQNNETIFNSTGLQQLTGAGTYNFFRFTKSETGTLDLTSTLDVADLFTISDGTLDDRGNSINLAADAVIDGIHSSSIAGNGIVFSGGAAQELRRSSAGTSTLGTITINNANGVNIPDGNGYNFNIDGGLRLENGVFNVGGSEIILGISAEITEVNTFGVSNMIRTNSSFTDGGVGKVFGAGARPDFIFPVGQVFYTPVSFDFSTPGNTVGSGGTIIVFPADEFHPTVDDGEELGPPNDPNGADTGNVLQYYWTIRTSGFSGLTSNMTLGYDQSQVSILDGSFTEADYIPARILSQGNPMFNINKFPASDINETTNLITFNFSGVGSNLISGDYFAGIDSAIPDMVEIFTVDVSGIASGDVYDVDNFGAVPSGAVVIVPDGFTLTLNADDTRFYATEIEAGGVLVIDNSTNHRLGELTGTGTMRILSNGINANPPAFSGDFFSCTGGALEYGGSGNYTVMTGITEIRNLSFIGSGVNTFANNDIVVCEDLIIDGPTLNNSNNARIQVDGITTLQSGTFNTGSDVLRFNGDFIINDGFFSQDNGGTTSFRADFTQNDGTFDPTSAGRIEYFGDVTYNGGTYLSGGGTSNINLFGSTVNNISGDFTGSSKFWRLIISNSNGIELNGSIEIDNFMVLSVGIINTNTNSVIFDGSAFAIPSIGRSTSYINGRVEKTLNSSGQSFNFPVGSTDRWRPTSVNNVSAGGLTWAAEFFAANAVANEAEVDNFDPTNPAILTLAENEYWKISDGNAGTSGATATVGLSWGAESDVSPVPEERVELEVMIWNDAISSWDNLDGVNFSSGHIQSEGRFVAGTSNGFSERIYTLGSPTLANPLPIVLKSFEGQLVENVIKLDWVTSSEVNNDYFELQYSTNGIDYSVLGTVDGSGNTTQDIAYSYNHRNPAIGLNYYRIKQVDFDGQFNIEDEIVVVEYMRENLPLSMIVYPNPTNESSINLRLEFDTRTDVNIVMFDLFGKQVSNQIITSDDLDNGVYRIVPDQSLNQGIYIISIEQYDKKITRRVIIQE